MFDKSLKYRFHIFAIMLSGLGTLMLFRLSVWGFVILFIFIEMVFEKLWGNPDEWKNTRTYNIALIVCCVGILFVILGRMVLYSDIFIITGAVLFAVTLVPVVVKDSIEHLKSAS